MLFWALSGGARMVAEKQRACSHNEELVKDLHPAGQSNRVRAPDPLPAPQSWPARQLPLLASSCTRSGSGSRSLEIGSCLRGLCLGHYEATFRNDEIDHASCSPRMPRT
jgi:hypothetical protein